MGIRKDNYTSYLKIERMHTYKQSQKKSKWKALKGSKVETQAQVEGSNYP
jgi:hypothetical protein